MDGERRDWIHGDDDDITLHPLNPVLVETVEESSRIGKSFWGSKKYRRSMRRERERDENWIGNQKEWLINPQTMPFLRFS